MRKCCGEEPSIIDETTASGKKFTMIRCRICCSKVDFPTRAQAERAWEAGE